MKAIVVQALPEPADELKKVSIGEAAHSKFIFYITKGDDIMLLHPVSDTCSDVEPHMFWGYRSAVVALSRGVDCRTKIGNTGITFQGVSREKAVLNATCAGRTVYTADHMNEVFDIYVQVRRERGEL